MDWENYLDILIGWVHDKNYHVILEDNGDNSICSISKTIEINNSTTLENKVYYLVHECGHLLVYKNKSLFELENAKRFGENTSSFKTLRVMEEVEAWKRGWNLALRLDIKLDPDKFEKKMLRALKKYIDWAAQ